MPFSVVFASVFRRLSLRVLTSLLQTPFFLHLSTWALKEMKWTLLFPYTLKSRTEASENQNFSGLQNHQTKSLLRKSTVNIRGGKARLYALLALTFCRHLMLLRQQAGRKVESRALCSTSRRLSCLRMTKSRRAWTHSPNSCDDSLPEGEVFQCLWETERFPHLKSLIPETKNPFPLEAWWFLFCTFNSFQKVIGHDHFSPYLSLKRSHITIWREISKLVFLTILS